MKQHYEDIRSAFNKDRDLADKLLDFTVWLERELCLKDDGCIGMSVTKHMCAPCRLRIAFTHTVGVSFINETGHPQHREVA